jgi:superfamily I DNA/RNA helicase
MLCEDSFPSSRVKGDPEGFEEERRVFYVAVTRTKDQLYLISPSLVQGSRGNFTMRISPFISELNPKVYRKSSVHLRSKKKEKRRGSSQSQKYLFKTADELIKEEEPSKKKLNEK